MGASSGEKLSLEAEGGEGGYGCGNVSGDLGLLLCNVRKQSDFYSIKSYFLRKGLTFTTK